MCATMAVTSAGAKELLDNLEPTVEKHLQAMGLSPREMRADWARVCHDIRGAMPRERLLTLSDGHIPALGFGIGSDTGTGKTMALAAVMRGFHRARIRRFAADLVAKGQGTLGKPAMWLHWPDTVTHLRAHAIDGLAEATLQAVEEARLLVLDDLGRERIKGSYVDDWAASQLDRVINHRYREELPILWTTNLQEQALVGLYGAALVSRLTEDAPLVWIEGLPSMRVR